MPAQALVGLPVLPAQAQLELGVAVRSLCSLEAAHRLREMCSRQHIRMPGRRPACSSRTILGNGAGSSWRECRQSQGAAIMAPLRGTPEAESGLQPGQGVAPQGAGVHQLQAPA